jgi:hypothetical protein
MAGAQAANDDIERIRELRAERLLWPAALDLEDQQREQGAAEQRRAERLQKVAARRHDEAESEQRDDHDINAKFGEADGHARLQDQAVERTNGSR